MNFLDYFVSKLFNEELMIFYRNNPIDSLSTEYSSFSSCLVIYSYSNEQVIQNIKEKDNVKIHSLRHVYVKETAKDYILTSNEERKAKVYEISYNTECIFEVEVPCSPCEIILSMLLVYNNKANDITLISSTCGKEDESLRVFDVKGQKLAYEFGVKMSTAFLDTYLHEEKTYVISGNYSNIKVFDYEKRSLFNVYSTEDTDLHYRCVLVYDKNVSNKGEAVYLITSNDDGYLRFFEFFTAELISRLKIDRDRLCGICLWDPSRLIVACHNCRIYIVTIEDFTALKVENELVSHKRPVCSVMKIKGSLISIGEDYLIKKWGNKEL